MRLGRLAFKSLANANVSFTNFSVLRHISELSIAFCSVRITVCLFVVSRVITTGLGNRGTKNANIDCLDLELKAAEENGRTY